MIKESGKTISVARKKHFLRGPLAQLVEQGIENPCVPGSIPGRATTSPLLVIFFITDLEVKYIKLIPKGQLF